MRRRRIVCITSVGNRMLQILFNIQLISPYTHTKRQVHSLLTQAFIVLSRSYSFTSSLPETNESNRDLPEPPSNFRGIAKSVKSKCSHLWANNSNKDESFVSLSLKDHILRLSNISPETVRRFWRVSFLRPQDVLDILRGFEFHDGKYDVDLKKVESFWGLFQWANEQGRDFQHLPQSCKIMAKMLVRVGLFREAERLLSRLYGEAILLDCHEIFSDLIEGYVAECDLERATLNYDRMRKIGLSPSFSCYKSLLDYLVQMNEVQLAYGVFLDMFEIGMARNAAEKGIYENVVRLLCMNGKVQEARNIVKQSSTLCIKPNNLVLDAIVSGYCEKKDYDDIPSFLVEIKEVPDVAVGNKVIWSLSRNYGADRANVFMQELELFGFCPNEITFGILIGQSCSEESLKNGFIFLSEMLSRNLKPDINTCHALMSGLLKEGLWKQSLDILLEMKDWGIAPNLSTFRVLLAGVLKARRFGEVKAIVGMMEDQGLIQHSLPQDHLSTALAQLGLDSLSLRVRRDNDMRFSRTEFYDDLGNGLYLETDLDGFEKTLVKVLDDTMVPDFNSLVLKNCTKGDITTALQMVDDMAQWGQVLSMRAASMLLNKLSASQMNIKTLNSLLEKMPNLIYRLDQGTLNKLVQKYSKRGYTCTAKMIFDNMVRMKLEIENTTYTALMIGLCRKGNLRNFHHCWQLARKGNWLPELKDGKALLGCLCQQKLLDEALELLETILTESFCRPLDASHAVIETLCRGGFTIVADVLAKELLDRGLVLDNVAHNHLLTGFCKEKKLVEAFALVDDLVAEKFDPALGASLQLIPLLCMTGNFDKAVLVKDRYLEKHPCALLSVCCALIDGLCQTGMVGEAFNFFQEITRRQLADTEVYNILILGCSRVHDSKKVGELLGVMIRKNIAVSISSYRSLVQQACASGKLSVAWSLKELMIGESSLPSINAYNILMFYLVQDTGAMDTLVNEIQNKRLQLDAVTYNLIIESAAHSNDVSRSLQYLKTMISEGFTPSNRCLRKVMSILFCLGKNEAALELHHEMESRGWIHGSMVIQINIVNALLRNGKVEEAVKFLNGMLSKGLIPTDKVVDYNYLIKRLCQHGELGKAVDLLNIMIKKKSVLDSTSFDYLIQGFCISHRLDIALDYHSEMLYRNLTPNCGSWNTLVCCLNEVGRVAESEKLLELMIQRGDVPSKEMYSAVINKYRSENNLSKASQVLRAMQRSGYEPDFETHWSLISNFSNTLNLNKEENASNSSTSGRFLSRLLSGIGFTSKD